MNTQMGNENIVSLHTSMKQVVVQQPAHTHSTLGSNVARVLINTTSQHHNIMGICNQL